MRKLCVVNCLFGALMAFGGTFTSQYVGQQGTYEVSSAIWNTPSSWEENAVPGLLAGDDIVFPSVWCGYYQLVKFPSAPSTNLVYGSISGSETTQLNIPSRNNADLTVADPSGYRGAWTFAGDSTFTVGSGASARPVLHQLSVSSGLHLSADASRAAEVTVSNLVSRGQLVKTGSAPLAVGATAGADSSLLVKEGAVRILARPEISTAACERALAKAVLHFDASDAATRTVDGNGRVTRLDDVRNNGKYAVPPTKRRDGKTDYTFTIPGPRLVPDAQNGLAVLDFGPRTETTPSYSSDNVCTNVTFPQGYPADRGSAALAFSTRSTRVREVFIVAADSSAAPPYMSFATDSHNYEFYRDNNGCVFSQSGSFSSPAQGCARGGDIRLNGGRILSNYSVAGTDFKLISFAVLPYEAVDGVYTPVVGLCYQSDQFFGGLKVGEFLSFTEYLSEDERASLCRHLVDKWGLEPRGVPAFGSIASAGTAEIETEEGSDVQVPQIHAQDGLVKKGAGRLVTEGLSGTADVRVDEGAFVYSGTVAPSTSPAPAAGAYRHFDASDATSIVSNGNRITRWNDTRGADKGYAVTITADMCGINNVAYGAPTVMPDTLNGRAVLDFGTFTSSSSDFANAAGMLFETSNVPNVRTIFLVASRANGLAFMLGGTLSYHFHPTFSRLINKSYAPAALLGGRCYVDGVPCDVTTHVVTESKSSFALYTFEATDKIIAETFGADRPCDLPLGPYRLGGVQIAEAILYDRPLSAQERVDTEAYLLKRWFAKDHPCSPRALATVQTAAGANFTKTGPTTVSVDSFGGAGTVHVADGTLKATGDCAGILSGAALHLDASVRDSVTVVEDATYGTVVSEWRDVRAEAPLKALPFTERLKPPAWQADGTAYGLEEGMPSVSCRSYATYRTTTDLHDSAAFYLADAAGNEKSLTAIREGFAVVRFPAAEFLFGDKTTYHFHRENSGALLHQTYAAVGVKSNAVWRADADIIDSSTWNPSASGSKAPFYVVSFVITNAASAGVTVGQLGRDRVKDCRVGGIDYAEVILFTKTLTEAEHLAVQGMLAKKWKGIVMDTFAPVPAALEVSAGATADFGAQTVSLAAVEGAGTVKAAALTGLNRLDATWNGAGDVDHLTVQGAVTLAASGSVELSWTGKGPVANEEIPVLTATSIANPAALANWTFQTPATNMRFKLVCHDGAIYLRALPSGLQIIFR